MGQRKRSLENLGINDLHMFENFYKGKRVFITGHTGFKGSWLAIWLEKLGAEVTGFALNPQTEHDNYVLSGIKNKINDLRGDIRDLQALKTAIDKYQPDIVFHLAAQPLVRLSYEIPIETYQTNLMGTINVMEAIRYSNCVKVGVMITTDKCYENKEHIWGYRENEAMGGYDPYSSSKGCCEIAINSWRRSFFIDEGKALVSVRAGNVIGGGDWALDRIVPDCIRAIEAGKDIEIRSPKAVRPWQYVLEPLRGYLEVARRAWEEPQKYSEGWNFGPKLESVCSVWDIATLLSQSYGAGKLVDVSERKSVHEASILLLDITKAKFKLGWEPFLDIRDTIEFTAEWYKRYRTENVYDLCIEQISKYSNFGK